MQDSKDIKHPLQLSIEQIEVSNKDLLSTKYWVSFDSGNILLDLLTVTSTSVKVQLLFDLKSHESATRQNLLSFLNNDLGFKTVFQNIIDTKRTGNVLEENPLFHDLDQPGMSKTATATAHTMNVVLYQKDGFLKGMVIRLEFSSNSSKFHLKIYAESEKQILGFVKTCSEEYEHECHISVYEKDQHLKEIELKDCLRKEMEYYKTNKNAISLENLDTLFDLEMRTDMAAQALMKNK